MLNIIILLLIAILIYLSINNILNSKTCSKCLLCNEALGHKYEFKIKGAECHRIECKVCSYNVESKHEIKIKKCTRNDCKELNQKIEEQHENKS